MTPMSPLFPELARERINDRVRHAPRRPERPGPVRISLAAGLRRIAAALDGGRPSPLPVRPRHPRAT